MESHAHDNLHIKCTSNYYETFQIKSWSFLSNLWLTSSSFTSFSSLFLPFFLRSNSKPFPLLPKSILSSLFPTSLLPLSPLLSDFQMLTADSCTCTAWGRSHCLLLLHSAQLSVISLHPIRREQTVSVKVYQRIWALEVGNVWKKVGERESVSAMYVCVLEQGQHTMCYF